jgi:hypothetical protein
MTNGGHTRRFQFCRSVVFFFSVIIGISVLAQPRHSSSEAFYLEVKGGLQPDFAAPHVRFSPDEHFVAVAGGGTIYIYDVRSGLEVRRILVTDNPFGIFPSAFAFSPSSDRFYAEKALQLLACPLKRECHVRH